MTGIRNAMAQDDLEKLARKERGRLEAIASGSSATQT